MSEMKGQKCTVVEFDPQSLRGEPSTIIAAGEATIPAAALSRTSRHIDFIDDGKLFEGHFTLYTQGLKSLIQVILNQQLEQQVILSDLQDQLNTLRLQTSKVRKAVIAAPAHASRNAVAGDTGLQLKELEDLRNRVKVLECFKTLWGVRTEEIESLVNTYGDPVATPEEYTACLLNLKPFRFLRSETHSSVATFVERRLSSSGRLQSEEKPKTYAARGNDSRSFRNGSRSARDRKVSEEEVQSSRGRPTRNRGAREDGSRSARDTKINERDTHSSHDRGTHSRSTRERGATNEEARSLRDRSPNERRVSEEEIQSSCGRTTREHRASEEGASTPRDRSARDHKVGAEEIHSPRGRKKNEEDVDGEELLQLASRVDALEQKLRRGGAAALSSTCKVNGPQSSPVTSAEFVDEQAREEIGFLERFVTKRFKELERVLAKSQDTSLSAANSAKDNGNSGGHVGRSSAGRSIGLAESGGGDTQRNANAVVSTNNTSVGSTGKTRIVKEGRNRLDTEVVDQVARDDAVAALDYVESLEKHVNRKLKEFSLAIGKDMTQVSVRPFGESEKPVFFASKPEGPMVDEMAREDAARSLEVVQELEEEWNRRWQSLEERLRIIGRATMNKGSFQPTTTSIDRKAREDASMSLMRIQQLEREIIGLRRLFQKHKAIIFNEEKGLFSSEEYSGAVPQPQQKVQRHATHQFAEKGFDGVAASGDNDYRERMQVLEQEVEQRMEEVNRALATLRSVNSVSTNGNVTGADVFPDKGSQVTSGQVVINSREGGGLELLEPSATFPLPLPPEGASVLVMTSGDAALGGPSTVGENLQGNTIILRSPQQGSFGIPLVTRELENGSGLATYTSPPMSGEQIFAERMHLQNETDFRSHDKNAVSSFSSGVFACSQVTEVVTCDASPVGSHLMRPNAKSLGGVDELASSSNYGGHVERPRSHKAHLRKSAESPKKKVESFFLAEQNTSDHTTPCVVYNCAWCAAQKRGVSTMISRPSH